MAYYIEPWSRLPRKMKKLLARNDPRARKNGEILHSKEHRRDRKRWSHYMDRKVKGVR